MKALFVYSIATHIPSSSIMVMLALSEEMMVREGTSDVNLSSTVKGLSEFINPIVSEKHGNSGSLIGGI